MKICPACDSRFPDDTVVCGMCGARLAPTPSTVPPEPEKNLVGRVIGGNYKVEALLGKGGMGAVFRARQLSLDRQVAIKVLLAPLAMEGEMLERFQREARSASNIGHPGIIQVIDMGYLEEGPPFIAMELLQGEDLRSKIHREGALGPDQALPLMLQICDALQATHEKGIVHRDLKPDNIFLVYRSGRVPMVKLLDFGLSKIKSQDSKLTNTGALLGTPHYMSPEQVKGDREVDWRADVYACGAILYEMIVGRSAYDGPSVQSILVSIMTEDPPPPRSRRPDIAASLEAVILKAMARDPSLRHQSMGEMAWEIASAGVALGISGIHPDALSSPGRLASRPPLESKPAGGGPEAVTTPRTPPPVSIPGVPTTQVGASKQGGGTVRGIVIGAVAAIVVLGAVVLGAAVAATAVGVLFMGSRTAGEDEPVVSISASEDEDRVSLDLGESLAIDVDGTDEREDAGEMPGSHLGQGGNPHLCCGSAGCAAVWQTESAGTERIVMRTLDEDLRAAGGEVAVSAEGKTARWPTCFARDDGGWLVMWMHARSPFSMDTGFDLHRVVVSAEGTPGEEQVSVMYNPAVMDEFQSAYHAARSGSRVVVVWNHLRKASSALELAVYDMNGEVVEEGVSVTTKPLVHDPTVACSKDRCVAAWVRPSLPMNHIQMLGIVSPSGKVVDGEVRAFDRGVLITRRKVVAAEDGVALTWVESDGEGHSAQMIARYSWQGEETLEPTSIAAFGTRFGQGSHTAHAITAADGTSTVIAQPRDTGDGREVALVVTVDAGGKVASRRTLEVTDGVYDAFVFRGPDGAPVLVYAVGMFGLDTDLYVIPVDDI